MLLTASSRPITILSLPLRSNSWLSASTIRRAVRGAAGAAGAAAAAGAVAGAGAPSMLPQFEQNASPAALIAPHEGHAWLPAGAGAGAAGAAAGAGAATGAAADSGSPHSSQKAEPSGFSWPKEHRMVITIYPPLRTLQFSHRMGSMAGNPSHL